MDEPSVMIVAKCPNGHETLMFPEKCVVKYIDDSFSEVHVMWDCPVCPKDNYKYEVEI